MAGADIAFEIPSAEREAEFVHEYLVPTWPELRASDAFDAGWFWWHGPFVREGADGLAGKEIVFVLDGDIDAIVERERDEWERLVADGIIDSWRVRRYDEEGFESLLDQQRDSYGPVGGERMYHLKTAMASFAVETWERFGDDLPLLGERSDENPRTIGLWAAVHSLMTQTGHTWSEEVEMCTRLVESRARSLEMYEDEEAGLELLDDAIAELSAYRDEFATEP